MGKYLLLTTGSNEEPRLVNMDHVRFIHISNGKAKLNFSDDTSTFVNESLMQIHAMLKERNK